MSRSTRIALASFALASAASAQVVVGPILNTTTGTRYYRLAPTTWADANNRAAALGGSLAAVHDFTTNEWIRLFVASVGGNTTDCFIGLNDVAVEGTYVWTNGEKARYFNWNAGEPNNFGGNEDFGVMQPSTGKWNDIPTGFNRPAIVEVTGAIRVPLEYPTIQGAINAAINGQTIVVSPGTYTESLNFGTKKLVVRSEQGAMVTTIRTAATSVGVEMSGGQGDETVLDGFTVIPNTSTPYLIAANDGQTVRRCRISNPGGVGVVLRGTATLSDSLLVGNDWAVWSSSIGSRVNVMVQNCTIAGNDAGVGASDNGISLPTTVTLLNCVTAGNAAPFGANGTSNIFFLNNVIQEGPIPGNRNLNPRFVSAPGADNVYTLADDYTLAIDSPCIDGGNNTLRRAMSGQTNPLDLAGVPRYASVPSVSNNGVGTGPLIDAGAFEFTPATVVPGCNVDFNNDGFVDGFDYDDFVRAFEEGC